MRLYSILKNISRTRDVALLSFIEPGAGRAKALAAVSPYCKDLAVVPLRDRSAARDRSLPDIPDYYYRPAMVKALRKMLSGFDPDIVHVEFTIMGAYIKHVGNKQVVLTEHDASIVDFDRSFLYRDFPEKDRFIKWAKMARFARETYGRSDAIIVMTENDRKLIRKLVPDRVVAAVPTGVDASRFAQRQGPDKTHNLLFIGCFEHYPNLEAAQRLAHALFPRIAARVPDATLTIVGSGAGIKELKVRDKRITITGEVEDVAPYLTSAAVFAAPMRLGRGIKTKIVEAMAAGLPVIAFPEAAEGIRCTSGRDIVIAHSDAEFVDSAVRLLKNPASRQKIGRTARTLALCTYTIPRMIQRIERVYDSL